MVTKKEFHSWNRAARERLFGRVTWKAFQRDQLKAIEDLENSGHDAVKVYDFGESPWVDGFRSIYACESEEIVLS
jgi:hypothetical protein